MGMSNFVLDQEEMFYNAADDVKLECDNIEVFINVMRSQCDLVKHLEWSEVVDVLKEIWHG